MLSSNDEVLIRIGVSRKFGPTYQGNDIRYPGVTFSFEDDTIGDSLKAVVKHSEDRSQEVKKVIINQKRADGEDRDALDEITECPTMYGEIARAVVKVRNRLLYPIGRI